ncbi:MAG: NUDIX hydrolase [Bacteroidota bacterium]
MRKSLFLLGISPIKGKRNPFDYYTRERMLKSKFGELVVLPLKDRPEDLKWSKNIDHLLNETFPGETFILYGSRDSFIPYYTGSFSTMELPAGRVNITATEIRNQYADKIFDSIDFRAGIIYGLHNQYLKVYPTVDIAIFRNNRSQVLLAQKAINDKWRFIGGFTDPSGESYELAALRELKEEVGPIEVSDMTYETSLRMDDWRYQSEEDKIITLFFTCDFISGIPTAKDDIATVKRFKLSEIIESEFSPEHTKLLKLLISKYNEQESK